MYVFVGKHFFDGLYLQKIETLKNFKIKSKKKKYLSWKKKIPQEQ